MIEVWKDVVGYEEYYQVSNLGNIKSKDRRVPTRGGVRTALRKGKILTQIPKRNNYMVVSLTRNVGDKKQPLVHRIVASAFLPNPENRPQVNHIDGNKANNKVSNLEWCTALENTRHAIVTGLRKYK